MPNKTITISVTEETWDKIEKARQTEWGEIKRSSLCEKLIMDGIKQIEEREKSFADAQPDLLEATNEVAQVSKPTTMGGRRGDSKGDSKN